MHYFLVSAYFIVDITPMNVEIIIMFLQVFANLQPLQVCMSFKRTMEIVKDISQDHDIEVQEWADYLTPLIDTSSQTVS